jgi:hypothetical protein
MAWLSKTSVNGTYILTVRLFLGRCVSYSTYLEVEMMKGFEGWRVAMDLLRYINYELTVGSQVAEEPHRGRDTEGSILVLI